MTTSFDRRQFLASAAAFGGGLAIGVEPAFPEVGIQSPFKHLDPRPWLSPESGGVEISPWLTIEADGAVTVVVNQTEVGQGVLTSNAMMICEELECDWEKVRVVYADPNRHFREHETYDHLRTDSSSSVRLGRELYQKVGAAARERLKAAAAARWGAPVSEVATSKGALIHVPTGRTLGFGDVAAEAARVTLDREPTIKQPDAFQLIGRRTPRFDIEMKSRGEAIYGIDIELPGMVFAAVRMPPTFGGALVSYDEAAALRRPGVLKVVAMRDIGLASGVAVIADSWWRAKSALDGMRIEWDAGPNAAVSSETLRNLFHARLGEDGPTPVDRGDVDGAFAKAARVLDATYDLPHQSHAAIEPANCVARIAEGRVDLWFASQQPEIALQQAAKLTGAPPANVFVHNAFQGGGFGAGGKHGQMQQALVIARELEGRPVKVLWTRDENLRHDNGFHPMGAARIRAAMDESGLPTALHIRIAGNDPLEGVPLMEYGPRKAKVAGQLLRGLQILPYAVPNQRVEIHTMKTLVPCGPWRSTGSYATTFYRESIINELARASGADPIAYRRRLIEAAEPASFEAESKQDWLKILDIAADHPDWAKPRPPGVGFGFAMDDRKSALPRGIVIVALMVKISVNKDGAVTVEQIDVTHEAGLAIVNPEAAERQIRGMMAWGLGAALRQEITLENGGVTQSNFHDYLPTRLAEFPKQINIRFVPTKRWIAGIGEEAVPLLAPAICDAIFDATGKRVRSVPIKNHDLSWA